jgi:hypothetical protein
VVFSIKIAEISRFRLPDGAFGRTVPPEVGGAIRFSG